MIAGVSPNGFYNPGMLNRMQKVQQEFQQLGKDLQTGNLASAQTDFAALQQMDPQAAPTASTAGNPIDQAFGQLAQDLQSGNLSAAQQDFVNLQQDFQRLAGAGHKQHAGGASTITRSFGDSTSFCRCCPGTSRGRSRDTAPCNKSCRISRRMAARSRHLPSRPRRGIFPLLPD